MPSRNETYQNLCFSLLFQQIYGDFFICLEIYVHFLASENDKWVSWPAKITASPFKQQNTVHSDSIVTIKISKLNEFIGAIFRFGFSRYASGDGV